MSSQPQRISVLTRPEVIERTSGTLVVIDEQTVIYAYGDDLGEAGREWLLQQLVTGAPHIQWIVVPGPLNVIRLNK